MRVNHLGHAALLYATLSLACRHTAGIERRAQEDGSYRADCKQSLTRCLTVIEEVCPQGYEIVQAHEDVRYAGPREINEPFVTSQVIARCRVQGSVLGGNRPVPQPTPSAAAPEAAPKPPTCFPGATQACVGPAACRGGQQCRPDGMAFGPCDCGRAAPPAPVPSPPDGEGPR